MDLVSYYSAGEVTEVHGGWLWTRCLVAGSRPVLLPVGERPPAGALVSRHTISVDGEDGAGGPACGPLEDVLGVDLSGVWDYSGLAGIPAGPIDIAYSIGVGCVWGRCTYCMDKNLGLGYRTRPGWDTTIVTDLAPGHAIRDLDLCISGPSAHELERVMGLRPAIRAERVITFARAGDLDCAIRRHQGRLDGFLFLVGLEAYSDWVLRLYRRGQTVSSVLAAVATAQDRGAEISVMMMSRRHDEDDEDVDRVSAELARLGCHISENGPIEDPLGARVPIPEKTKKKFNPRSEDHQ